MISYLLLTAFTVSVDSFACGFLLPAKKGERTIIVLSISVTVFLMCLITNYLAYPIRGIDTRIGNFAGLILIGVGLFNLLRKEKTTETKKSTFKQSLLTGFAVGIDGALGNLSLSLMGINAFYVPLTIALMHAVLVWLGSLLAGSTLAKNFLAFKIIAPICLIALGTYKLLGIFL